MKRIYVATLESSGIFPLQASYLAWSLTKKAMVRPSNIKFFYFDESITEKDISFFKELEISTIRLLKTSLHMHPWCRKLICFPMVLQEICDEVVFLDLDTLVLEEPPPSMGMICGKPVDFSNPPFAIVSMIFKEAGLGLQTMKSDIDQETTAFANCNGGVYVIPKTILDRLASEWVSYAAWSMRHKKLYGEFQMHIDQLAFSLAIAKTGLPFQALDRKYNFPTHVAQSVSRDLTPAILHYHRALDEQMLLRPVEGLTQVNTVIKKANDEILQWRREAFDNEKFWNARYTLFPNLGSGVGSRGENLIKKQNTIKRLVDIHRCKSLVDICGGDGESVRIASGGVQLFAYDISTAARSLYLKNNPHALWQRLDFITDDYKKDGDLNLCLDVLIYLSSETEYQNALQRLCSLAGPVLLSGFSQAPKHYGPMTFFHESLELGLRKTGRLYLSLGKYEEVEIFYIFPQEPIKNPRNIKSEVIAGLAAHLESPLALIECVLKAQKTLGFFPNQSTRCVEYPWTLNEIRRLSPLSLVDIGAGVNPVPLLAADHNIRVTTIDNHGQQRILDEINNWNEWGFLDYGKIDPRVSSLNISFEAYQPSRAPEMLSCISVLEHLPSHLRRLWIQHASKLLKKGGVFLVSLDTVPFSRSLWNRCEGKQVESAAAHGTVPEFEDELKAAGFQLVYNELQDNFPFSCTGLYRAIAVRH